MKRISIIGSGSSYTPLLVDYVLKNFEEYPVSEIRLFDISEINGRTTFSFMERVLKKSGKPLQMLLCSTLDEALDGADFAVTQIRVGGLEARKKDILLGNEFGLVGQETTGVGGLASALRTIPEILRIAGLMERCAEKNAWLINFTNPSGIVTEAILRHSKVNALGICNGSISLARDIASLLHISPDELVYDYAGANHLAGIIRLRHRGKDILKSTIELLGSDRLKGLKNVPDFELPPALIQLVGFIPVSYLKYFWLTRTVVEYLQHQKKTRADEVMELEEEVKAIYGDGKSDELPEKMNLRGGSGYNEIAYRVMSALSGAKYDRLSVITHNRGAIANFDHHEVLELPVLISENGVEPITQGRLPVTLEGLVQQVKKYERLAVEAAVEKNKELALLAMLNHPLIGDADRIESIFDRLLEINKKYLKGWS